MLLSLILDHFLLDKGQGSATEMSHKLCFMVLGFKRNYLSSIFSQQDVYQICTEKFLRAKYREPDIKIQKMTIENSAVEESCCVCSLL